MKPLLLLLASCAVACGEMRTIVVEGTFNRAINLGFWVSLELALPYRITCEIDSEAEDEAPDDPDLGIYETENAFITLAFGEYYETGVGDYFFRQPVTQVRIWRNHEGLKGITFGNDEEFEAYTLWCGEYTGIYGSSLVPVSWGGLTIPDDSLHWLWDLQDNETLTSNSYAEFDGWNPEHTYHVNLHDTYFTYTVQ